MTVKSYMEDLGWDLGFEEDLALLMNGDAADFGRVTKEHRGSYSVATARGEINAGLSGRFRRDAETRAEMPAVGDWVVLRASEDGSLHQVEAILPRRSKFSRKVAGVETDEQILAANIDFVFVVTSLNSDLNLRRLERYLTVAWSSGATPVVVLTKSDLSSSVDQATAEVAAVAAGVSIHAVSSLTGEGLEDIRAYLDGGRSVVLLGSSGVGKSSLVNRLMGEQVMVTKDIREDDKGRHTTSHRELLLIPTGGVVIDTPGMRELQLWDEPDGLDDAFEDVTEVAALCRFNDCGHNGEPGCAVAVALAEGRLTAARISSYNKLQRELKMVALKRDKRAAASERRRFKAEVRQRARRRRNNKSGWA